jgi:D-alanyl-lipoteichoic acid acyltransferase DltB (MBOAT superfamily)
MLFHSLQYALFLPCVVAAYWLVPHRFRWILLLLASYTFYASWRLGYVLLLIASTLVDYAVGRGLAATADRRRRRGLLLLSLALNLGLLFFFKYWNFFGTSLGAASRWLGAGLEIPLHDVLLPLGISFYTFQSLSYIIDVYRGTIPAERHLGYYAVFVSFFPQLIAGPIERAGHMLPQYKKPKRFRDASLVHGLQWILWGLFLKVVVADNLALYVNGVYEHVHEFRGLPLLLATEFFAFQIFADFAGYSAIAIGSADLLGIQLMENFRRPYLSFSVTEFWRRWHISLSNWFRDYVYIPLGGNRVPFPQQLMNIFITFLLSGLWHGANWTFILWGCLHGFYLIAERIIGRAFPRTAEPGLLMRILKIVVTFHLVAFAWIFFRADSIGDALYVVTHLWSGYSLSSAIAHIDISPPIFVLCLLLIAVVWVASVAEERSGGLSPAFARLRWLRWPAYYALAFAILFLAANRTAEFIYFQF